MTKENLDNLEEKIKEEAEEFKEDIKDDLDNAHEVFEEIIDSIDFEAKYKESLAAMENLRKRLDLEKMDIYKYRSSSFIQSILPTLDMFELAMNANNVSEEVKNWLIGFEMILRNFKTVLETEGVIEITTNPGDDFDSEKHYAIEERESEEIEPGKIIEVKQKGYKLHDRLLRPATVVVAAQNKGE